MKHYLVAIAFLPVTITVCTALVLTHGLVFLADKIGGR